MKNELVKYTEYLSDIGVLTKWHDPDKLVYNYQKSKVAQDKYMTKKP